MCISAATGALQTVGSRELAPGSGLQLKGCTVIDATVTAAPPPLTVTRRFSCAGGNATAVATETFTTDAGSGSVRWDMNLSSSDSDLWTTEITSALGYARSASARVEPPLAWLGGPRSNDLPSADPAAFHDPIAPFPIVGASASTAATTTPSSAMWYAAQDYNAVYAQHTPVPGKFVKANSTASAPQCQQLGC